MSVLVTVNDHATGLQAVIRLSGNYSPDVVDDLKSRVIEMYRSSLAARIELGEGLDIDEPEEQEEEQASE